MQLRACAVCSTAAKSRLLASVASAICVSTLVHVRSRQRRPSMAAVFFRIQCAIALILASSTIPITKSYTYLQTQTPTSGGLFAKQRVPAGFTYRQGHNRVAGRMRKVRVGWAVETAAEVAWK